MSTPGGPRMRGNLTEASRVSAGTVPASTPTVLVLVLGVPWVLKVQNLDSVRRQQMGWEMKALLNYNGFRFPSA